MKADIDFELMFDTNDDYSQYTLVAKLQNASFEVTDLKTYFWSDLTIDDLNVSPAMEENSEVTSYSIVPII